MPGTVVRDALGFNLAAGATLNAAGTTSGTVAEINSPQEISFELATGTVTSTGNSATINVELQSADNLAFNVGVVSHGRFSAGSGTDAAQSNTTKLLRAVVQKRYARATVILGGTAPVYTGTTIKPVLPNDRRVAATTTA